MRHKHRLFSVPAGCILSGMFAAASVVLQACTTAVTPYGTEAMEEAVAGSLGRYMGDAEWVAVGPAPRRDAVGDLQIEPRFLEEDDRMAGPNAYGDWTLDPGLDLFGRPVQTSRVNLHRAITTAVENNLDLQFARVAPAISQARIAEAEAAFDWNFFTNFTHQSIDEPRTATQIGLSTVGTTTDQRDVTNLSSGIRRTLETGARVAVQQDLAFSNNRTAGLSVTPDPVHEVEWVFQIDQPLLRAFGTDVTLAQVRIARNAERDRAAQLERELLRVVGQTEEAYWNLVQAYWNVLIAQRSLKRGDDVLSKIIARQFDATPDQRSDARATVVQRRSDLTSARLALSDASDRLKVLMNDESLPLGSDALILPADRLIEEPVSFNLKDCILSAISGRPEVRQSLLSVDDTSIRLLQANNARLPRLDLRLQMRLNALEDDFRAGYADVVDRQFIDYLIGFEFEQSIGNRAAESVERVRRLEQMQAVVSYRNTVMQVVSEVVSALRNVTVAYQLIEEARASRIAQAENLRVFLVQSELIRENTVLRLAEEFRRQDALSASERNEVRALVQYANSVESLHRAMGTSLKRNRIQFVVPDAAP